MVGQCRKKLGKRIELWCASTLTGIEFPDPPDPPDLAVDLWRTRLVNQWLGTAYSIEEITEMDPLVFTVMGMVAKGMDPPKKGK